MKQFAPRHMSVVVVLSGLSFALYLAVQPRSRAVQTKNCEINLKQIGLAIIQYSRDYDEQFPRAVNWADSVKPYAIGSSKPNPDEAFAKRFHCPTTGGFYSYNRHLQMKNIERLIPISRVPLVIEVAAGQTKTNLSGAGELWPPSPIHETAGTRGNNVLFADGHVELTNIKPTFRKFATPTPKPSESKPAKTVKP